MAKLGRPPACPSTPEREKKRERDRSYHRAKPGKQYWVNIRARLGVTQELYWAYWELQNGTCPLCLEPLQPPGALVRTRERTVVDHDHNTMVIRGLLHNRCNIALGHMEQNPVGVQVFSGNVVSYLKAAA